MAGRVKNDESVGSNTSWERIALPGDKHHDWRNSLGEIIPFRNQRIGQFVIGCLQARNGGVLPVRQLLQPELLAPCLPYVWLYEYDDDRGDFICQLAGEEVQAAVGIRMRGAGLADIVAAKSHPLVAGRWHHAISTLSFMYGTHDHGRDESVGQSERIVMPISSVDGRPNMVFGISVTDTGKDVFLSSRVFSSKASFYKLADFPA